MVIFITKNKDFEENRQEKYFICHSRGEKEKKKKKKELKKRYASRNMK